MQTERCKVEFLPFGIVGYFPVGTSILEAARELDVELPSLCGGAGICGKCLIEVTAGVDAPTQTETEFLSEQEIAGGVRLACRTKIVGPCVVFIPKAQQQETSAILTFGERRQQNIDPVVLKVFLQIPKPTLDGNPFDAEQLLEAANLNTDSTKIPLDLLRKLPKFLREADYRCTLTTAGNNVIALEVEDTTQHSYGIAVDIGTTTVVGKLFNLIDGAVLAVASRLNSQRGYGEDVISRISYAREHDDGLRRLHKRIIDLLNEIVGELVAQAQVPRGHVYEMVCVGNTVMQHFLVQVDPSYLAEMPYVPVFRGPLWLPALELGIQICETGMVYILPHIGRYVGGDTVGVILSAELDRTDEVILAVDIGTNGEVVLTDGKRMVSCSTAAGPAFEGAHIKHGMRATSGAIDRVLVEKDDLFIHTVNDSSPVGICGSGLIDAVGELLNMGVIDEYGRLLGPEELDEKIPRKVTERIRQSDFGYEILLSSGEKQDITLTQRDIREVQLAKGAIAAGIEILLNELNLSTSDISKVILAGAFGQFIRKDMAVQIGLLPKVAVEKIFFIGNGACAGAELALLSRQARTRAEAIPHKVEYIEISAKPEFQDIFAEKMMFL